MNIRMKDYFDLWILSGQFDFDSVTLAEALAATVGGRRPLPKPFLTSAQRLGSW
jgi:hypothetical protein